MLNENNGNSLRVRLDTSKVWSATPTPFTENLQLDVESLHRMIAHHLRLGCDGLFMAGTCGEGPWMPENSLRALVREIHQASQGRLLIAVQVSDNSAARILSNMENAAEDGADIAIIAPPYFMMNAQPRRIYELYREAAEKSPLPVGIYDRGQHGAVVVPKEVLFDTGSL